MSALSHSNSRLSYSVSIPYGLSFNSCRLHFWFSSLGCTWELGCLGPCIPVRNMKGALGSWFQHDTVLAIMAVWKVNQKVEILLSVSVFHSLSLLLLCVCVSVCVTVPFKWIIVKEKEIISSDYKPFDCLRFQIVSSLSQKFTHTIIHTAFKLLPSKS